ncbi:hypothetical protein A9308_05020 [Moraxella atlantae]|uniref:Uncharacterized protein n=1 Tax=Faucicola atlantae TaxID=34059 RepID=A0A1B8QEB4_9GAMM|nr:hypothetical protein A9308_05020 [Moraxella atlantae]
MGILWFHRFYAITLDKYCLIAYSKSWVKLSPTITPDFGVAWATVGVRISVFAFCKFYPVGVRAVARKI